MNLVKLKEKVRKKTLAQRSIDRIVMSSDFELAYTDSNEWYQQQVIDAIEGRDRYQLKSLIRERLLKQTPFHSMTFTQLRVIAKHNRIDDYPVMNKLELIRKITAFAERVKNEKAKVSKETGDINTEQDCCNAEG